MKLPSSNKRWNDLSKRQKGGIIGLGVVQLALLAAALLDLRQRDDNELNGSKRLWSFLVFIEFFGPLAYFIFGRKR